LNDILYFESRTEPQVLLDHDVAYLAERQSRRPHDGTRHIPRAHNSGCDDDLIIDWLADRASD
jgi:hypothetical protein